MSSRIVGNFSADGSSAAIRTTDRPIVLIGSGTFGAGTITVEVKLVDGSWQALNTAIIDALAAPGQVITKLDFPDNFEIRATLAGATSPNINYILQA